MLDESHGELVGGVLYNFCCMCCRSIFERRAPVQLVSHHPQATINIFAVRSDEEYPFSLFSGSSPVLAQPIWPASMGAACSS